MGRTQKRFKISITALLFLFMLANLIFAFIWQGKFWISPLDHYHKAKELETGGNLEAALQEAKQASRKKPHDTPPLLDDARSLCQQCKYWKI